MIDGGIVLESAPAHGLSPFNRGCHLLTSITIRFFSEKAPLLDDRACATGWVKLRVGKVST